MGDQQISDIRQYELSDGSLPPGRAGRLARFLGEIVSAGSVMAVGDFQTSTIRCRRRPSRRPCPGRITVGRDPDTDDIHWACTTCKDHGVITNWQQSRWDLSLELKQGRIVSLSAVRARRARRAAGPAPVTVYELEVELINAPVPVDEAVMRRVRVDSHSTLHDLHRCLLQAFDRSEEQPYEFMFGPPYEPDTRRYAGPASLLGEEGEPWEAQLTRIGELDLSLGESFGYLYSFTDEWVHRILVVSIQDNGDRRAPSRVLERVGPSPKALPPSEEEQWEDPQVWDSLDSAYPLTSLYGPYHADTGPDPDEWLALDDLERQLLIVEAHSRAQPDEHPPVDAMLLHALIHDLAELRLARLGRREARQLTLQHPRAREGRHAVIHALGHDELHQLLKREGAREVTHRPGARTRSKTRGRTPDEDNRRE